MRIWLAMALAAGLSGCGSGSDDSDGGGGFPPDSTCGISITLSGGIDHTIPPSESVACGSSLAFDSSVSVGYIPIGDGPVKAIVLDIEGLDKEETGAAFPASIDISHRDDRSWQADGCEVEVVENVYSQSDDFADFYRTRGSGSCAVVASPDQAGDAEIQIGDFVFVVSVPWAR